MHNLDGNRLYNVKYKLFIIYYKFIIHIPYKKCKNNNLRNFKNLQIIINYQYFEDHKKYNSGNLELQKKRRVYNKICQYL